ncbi:membrane transporter [Scheffersomyces amazonensis]|uniref:membrane transporter n=1 Tax=Scheffersomyces amazonensis TaxID=1078765 RepID=UPI00315DFB4A
MSSGVNKQNSILMERKLVQDINVEQEEYKDYPKDGKFAMLISICAMLLSVSSWGVNSAYGIFLNFYLTTNQFPGATEYEFALIGGLVVFLAQFCGSLSIVIYKTIGFKKTTMLGVVIQTTAYILSSISTKIWHLFLTEGLLVGISFSLTFIPSTVLLPTWLDKRMSTGLAICSSGAGFGGVIFSLAINALINLTGNQRWALRMCAIVTCVISCACIAIIRERRINKKVEPPKLSFQLFKENMGQSLDLKLYKYYVVCLLCGFYTIAVFSFILLLFTMASYAKSNGLNYDQSSVLTSLLNGFQVIGRPLMGITGDKIGRINTTAIVSITASLTLYAYWINATSYGSLIGCCILLGLCIGVGGTMSQSIGSDLLILIDGKPDRLPALWSNMNIVSSIFCLVAEVIALAMVVPSSSHPFLHTQIFVASCFMVCFILMLLIREWTIRVTLQKRLSPNCLEKIHNQKVIEMYQRLLQPNTLRFLQRMFYQMGV